MSDTSFPYSEALLAREASHSRGDIKSYRDQHLNEGVDWKKVGGEIALSTSGVRTLWKRLQNRPGTLDLSRCLFVAAAKKNGANGHAVPLLVGSASLPIPTKMRVTKIPLNPRVVLAVDEHGLLCSVEVGHNDNFVVGDWIDTAPHLTQPGFWRLLGPMPRSRRRVGGRPL